MAKGMPLNFFLKRATESAANEFKYSVVFRGILTKSFQMPELLLHLCLLGDVTQVNKVE